MKNLKRLLAILWILTKTILVFSLVIYLNWLSISYAKSFDLTQKKIYSLAPESVEIISELQQPVYLTINSENISQRSQILLDNYLLQSSFFSYNIAKSALDSKETISDNQLLLKYGNKHLELKTLVTPLGLEISENELSNAIAKITKDQTFHLYFIEPYNNFESNNLVEDFSQLTSKLQQKKIEVQKINLVDYQIPRNADLLVIAKPLEKFSSRESQQIKKYLAKGGSLLAMLLPHTEIGLEPLWQEWGIDLDKRLLINSQKDGDRPPIVIETNNYVEHPITKDLNSSFALFANSRPLRITPRKGITATNLIKASDATWAESNFTDSQLRFDSSEDLKDNLNLAIALEREDSSRMVVFGNGVFASDTWLKEEANRKLILNTIQWLIGSDRDLLEISEPNVTQLQLVLTPWKINLISSLGTKIMPGLAGVLVILLLWRNKYSV